MEANAGKPSPRKQRPRAKKIDLNDEQTLIDNLIRLAMGRDAIALRATIFMLQAKFGWSQGPALASRDIGKKAQANIDAQSAHEDSDWGKLVN